MSERTRPTRAGSALALVVGTLAVVAGALGGWQAGAIALVGLLVVAAGLGRASRRLVTAGSAALVVAVLVAGLRDAGTGATLVGCGAAVVAWDVGRNAIDLGDHGRAARSAETRHAGATALVAAFVAVGGGAVYRSATAGQPTTALVLLAVAALLVVLALWN